VAEETQALATMREIVEMIDGWAVPLSPDQAERLAVAVDTLYGVAVDIDRENWQRHGSA
jgi:hypothetical protein